MATINEILVRASELLETRPGFKLVGRDRELEELSSILIRMLKRNVIVTGRPGVGISSVVLGLESSKNDLGVSAEIVGKRFYWIDSDALFESGSSQTINKHFKMVRQTLTQTRDAVLVVEDTVDFIRAAQANGCSNVINGLMGDLKNGKYQAILETNDENLGEVLAVDGDALEFSTLYEVKEPSSENLRVILSQAREQLQRHHGITIADDALETAASLTEKYKLTVLRAQPDAAVSLLDHSMTDLIQQSQARPIVVTEMEEELESIVGTPEEEALRTRIQNELEAWESRQNDVRRLYRDITEGETEIRKLEAEIERLRTLHRERTSDLEKTAAASEFNQVVNSLADTNLDTEEISALRDKIGKINRLISDANSAYQEKIQKIHSELKLDSELVLKSFSKLSGIPVDTLNEDERTKLKELDTHLASRVIGQPEPVTEVAKAVKRARLGLKLPNKPSGTFMFLGPSGVGKTELAKALSDSLSIPLLRFDMSEYMERHAVAKLIGAPPGYEGYEQGGILTNSVRKNPYCVILFDEIEKAHADVFNVMLQILDDARLTDSRGLTASFKDATIIMTTNIGTRHFLDQNIEFEESKKLAKLELYDEYKPEFLGRFGGNIFCFNRLDNEVLEMIAKKDLKRINGLVDQMGISLGIKDQELLKIIEEKYVMREGARSILGYIDRNITSAIADFVLDKGEGGGQIEVTYDEQNGQTQLNFQ